jgi:hypothetical protein
MEFIFRSVFDQTVFGDLQTPGQKIILFDEKLFAYYCYFQSVAHRAPLNERLLNYITAHIPIVGKETEMFSSPKKQPTPEGR